MMVRCSMPSPLPKGDVESSRSDIGGGGRTGKHMRDETIAIHAGYEPDPPPTPSPFRSTRPSPMLSTAPTTARRCSISRAEGYRYSRIANPTTAVLEKRIAELEGGVGALAVAHRPGRAAFRRSSISPIPAATSSRSRSSTARRTRCSATSCRARASPAALPTATRPMRSSG